MKNAKMVGQELWRCTERNATHDVTRSVIGQLQYDVHNGVTTLSSLTDTTCTTECIVWIQTLFG